jgi:hypothetical protein
MRSYIYCRGNLENKRASDLRVTMYLAGSTRRGARKPERQGSWGVLWVGCRTTQTQKPSGMDMARTQHTPGAAALA